MASDLPSMDSARAGGENAFQSDREGKPVPRQAAELPLPAPEAFVKSALRWKVQPLPDGSLRIISRTATGAGLAAFLALFWNGCTWTLILGKLRDGSGVGRTELLFFTVFAVIGLGFLGGFFQTLLGREEWRVDRNRFLRIHTVLGRERVEHFEEATLALEATDNDGSITWHLVLLADSQRYVLDTAMATALPGIRDGAHLIANRTGWPVKLPQETAG